ncbi:hypothetical protein B296_00051177 [Ensete ventricosum]|uniref:Uncharacterized protein n=1 Tax=Ensete ventricosum TaxID=4639 RepID=A0A426XBW6_ENSVE|nr:hypothetical protein B296_00051177 [Ensete ventricosum]
MHLLDCDSSSTQSPLHSSSCGQGSLQGGDWMLPGLAVGAAARGHNHLQCSARKGGQLQGACKERPAHKGDIEGARGVRAILL